MIFKHFQKTLDHPGGKKREKNCNGHIWNQRIKRHISTRPRKMRTKCLIRGQPNIAGATIVLYCATWHYLS